MITNLPESIGDLRNLEILDIRDNRISDLPLRFGCINKLIKLKVKMI